MYDVTIIGGGAVGTGAAKMVSQYTNAENVAIIEKEKWWGQVNSNKRSNSQSLHKGPQETNFSKEKAIKLKQESGFVEAFLQQNPGIGKQGRHSVIGVGTEISEIKERYGWVKDIYSDVELFGPEQIREVEPKVMEGRQGDIIMLTSENGWTVDYGLLAQTLIEQSDVDTILGHAVVEIIKERNHYRLEFENRESLETKQLIIAAGAHSLPFAHKLGIAQDYFEISVAGRFFYTQEVVNGKVYTRQYPGVPMAAPHADPDLAAPGKTRWGPTAIAVPVLQTKSEGIADYWMRVQEFMGQLGSSPLEQIDAIRKSILIFKNPELRDFFTRSLEYALPGKEYAFLPCVQKIVPSTTLDQLAIARDEFGDLVGGIRPQLVNRKTGEMALGTGTFFGDCISVIVTPSPGASNLLGIMQNVLLEKQRRGEIRFDNTRFIREHTPLPYRRF